MSDYNSLYFAACGALFLVSALLSLGIALSRRPSAVSVPIPRDARARWPDRFDVKVM